MSLERSYFLQGAPPDVAKSIHEVVKPGKIITTHKPTPTKWRVPEVLAEFDHQRERDCVREGNPSYAALLLPCTKVSAKAPRIQALMRVYLQIPYTDTEYSEWATRATQAVTFKPEELETYQALSNDSRTSQFTPALLGWDELQQGQSGLVPGGF